MSRSLTGWLLLVAMVGTMIGLVSADLKDVGQWAEVRTPQFVGAFFQHLSVVIGSFVAGQVVPTLTTKKE